MNDPRTRGLLLTDVDLHLLAEGSHFDIHTKLGVHLHELDGVAGAVCSVWAPAARAVSVVGDWDGWSHAHPLAPIARTGVWDTHVPGAAAGHRYKLHITTRRGAVLEKADPFARASELPPGNASIVVGPSAYAWNDDAWLANRPRFQAPAAPMSIYEVHLGSWRRAPDEGNRVLTYREIAPLLAEHCVAHGFTHVELMPVMEHPFSGSWGYQITGFFAPTARYGTPDDFRAFVDVMHDRGVGVLLDWPPAHFPDDAHGLARFDGTALYEHRDPREGRHPDWGSLIFNYGRHEVAAFLISNAVYWLDDFHIDGLRVDAVASMLYRDYSRPAGEWIPNRYGGRENLEAIAVVRRCSNEVHRRHPDALFVAEESTAFPKVTAPVADGGLGFTQKWDLGWMHDTLRYLARDPVHRRWHQNDLTFRAMYAQSERFVLALSHDEVVHGKRALLAKMPGDDWQQRANVRLLFGLQHGTPGKKLLFMGAELGMRNEWQHDTSLDWHLLDDPRHAAIARWVATLNQLHRDLPALHARDDDAQGFEWIDCTDARHSVLVWLRRSHDDLDTVVCVVNCTPSPHPNYRVGLPAPGAWTLLANSDDGAFGGSGFSVSSGVNATDHPFHDRPWSAELQLPPLAFTLYGRTR